MPRPQAVPELDFLREYEINDASFRRAPWLLADFDDAVWPCRFGRIHSSLDFRVVLDDGSGLTDPQHRALLDNLKRFLILQTHPSWGGASPTVATTQYDQIAVAIHVLDYFFVRARHFEIARSGFARISANDLAMFLVVATRGGSGIKAALYNAVEELCAFLRAQQVTETEYAKAKAQTPDINRLEGAERSLPLTDQELLRARVALLVGGYYDTGQKRSGTGWTYNVAGKRLFRDVYAGRILGNTDFHELGFGGLQLGARAQNRMELAPVPVQAEAEAKAPTEARLRNYVRSLTSMTVAAEHGFPLIPPAALVALEERAHWKTLPLKPAGRVQTVPMQVVNYTLKHALEFVVDYGDALVDTYLSCAAAAREKEGQLYRIDLRPHLRPTLMHLHVSRWKLPPGNRPTFFEELRRAPGLYELLVVLVGAIVILVNTVMARRISELLSLSGESCLREASGGSHLRFRVSKANLGELRELVERPIPRFGVRAIRLLLRLQDGLSQLGVSAQGSPVFSVPHFSRLGLTRASEATIQTCLNRFCDFFAVPGDARGRRYYLRTHQLRRYFALMFFWHYGVGGLDTLRYMLGHVDMRHVWQYVTEATPGDVLRRVEAEYVGSKLREDSPETAGLADFLSRHYGLSTCAIMRDNAVTDYLEDLLEQGRIEVTPEFLYDNRDWRILIRVGERT